MNALLILENFKNIIAKINFNLAKSEVVRINTIKINDDISSALKDKRELCII